MQRRYDDAIAAAERSIEYGPNSALSYILFAQNMYFVGNFEEAIALAEKAVRLCPGCPLWYRTVLGRSYMFAGRYQDAILIFNKMLEQAHGSEYVIRTANQYLTITYSMMGQTDKAQFHLSEIKKYNPKYSMELVRKRNQFFKDPNHLEAMIDALRKAGLPDKPPLPLPDKPSIAVLAFENMSGDPEQEYFSDGLSEEIITALSKTPKLFVIARNSSFSYKGKPVKVQQIGRELGVKYILEGSVRKSSGQIRVTAQLVDAKTGNHLWAERYDRELKDIFALQDEITMKIINALQVELTEGEHARMWGKGTNNLEAYLKFMRAREHFLTQTKEGNALARRMVEEAIALDPEFAPSYHVLARTHMMDVFLRTTKSTKQSLKLSAEFTKKAISLDDSFAQAYGFLGFLYTLFRKHEEGIAEAQKGVDLDPNGAFSHYYLNFTLRYAGRFEEAVSEIEKAIRLNPIPPVPYYRGAYMSYIGAGQYDKAIDAGKKAIAVAPNDFYAHSGLAASYILSGREEEARSAAAEVIKINPKFSVKYLEKTQPFKNKKDLEQLTTAMRKAGLPE